MGRRNRYREKMEEIKVRLKEANSKEELVQAQREWRRNFKHPYVHFIPTAFEMGKRR